MLPIVQHVKDILIQTFDQVQLWFEEPEEISQYRPESYAWTIQEILEHITLVNHYLLILIDKGKNKALRKTSQGNPDLNQEVQNSVFHGKQLEEVGNHPFPWERPLHMEPSGNKDKKEIKFLMQQQIQQCLDILEALKNGEGVLCKTTMSVNKLGKLNVYEYIYFLAQHARRHIRQMEKNKQVYFNQQRS